MVVIQGSRDYRLLTPIDGADVIHHRVQEVAQAFPILFLGTLDMGPGPYESAPFFLTASA